MRQDLITTARSSRASAGFKNQVRRVRGAAALAVAAALLNLSATVAFASPVSAAETGELMAAGAVTVDGLPAVSGQTFFSGSTVATAEGSSSALGLGNLARLELSAETALKLDFSRSNLGGVLDAGRVRVSVPAGLAASLTTAGALVVTDASQPSVFRVSVETGKTTVSVERGRVELRAGDGTQTLTAGQTSSSSDGARPEPSVPQNFMNDRKRLWAGVGIAAGLAVLIVAVTGRADEEEEFVFGCGPVLLISDAVDPGLCR